MKFNRASLILSLLAIASICIAAVTPSSFSFGNRTSGDSRILASEWQTAIAAGGPATLDAATITNPTTQITNSTTIELSREGYIGQYIGFRMGYTGTPSVPLVATIWGRTDDSAAWQKLRNLNGDTTMTFTYNTVTDETDGTITYTAVDPLLHVVDPMGCNKIRVGVNTAFAGTVTNTSIVQAKPFD